MRRRDFIKVIGGAAATWPLAARAQQSGRLPTIGFLGASSPLLWGRYVAAFEQRLGELGWSKGSTVAIEYRWAEGRSERYTEIAAEFIRLKVDIIVTSGGAGLAAKRASSTTPIVLAVANDPVGTGLVASFARPGGNVTGLSLEAPDLSSKRLGLLREVLPDLRRLAIMGNASYSASVLEMRDVQAATHTLGLEVVPLEIRRAEDIVPVFEAHNIGVQALYVCGDPLVSANWLRINTLALAARLPTVCGVREYVVAGGLMSYGPSFSDLFRRAADLVDKILHGTKPGDIPVERPTKFDLVLNLTTAKAIGLTIPESFLLRADELIE